MKLRAKCKCGAEFEARAFGATMRDDFRVWQAIHNTRCYGVTRWDTGDDGKIHITARSPTEAVSAS